jgi:hypothetical protein
MFHLAPRMPTRSAQNVSVFPSNLGKSMGTRRPNRALASVVRIVRRELPNGSRRADGQVFVCACRAVHHL